MKKIQAFRLDDEIPNTAKFISADVVNQIFYYEIKVQKEASKTVLHELETIERVIKYLNRKLNKKEGKGFRSDSTITVKNIKARLKEGHEPEDFKKVIDIKVQEWANSDQAKHLNPETLFGNKFEKYLQQEESSEVKGLEESVDLLTQVFNLK